MSASPGTAAKNGKTMSSRLLTMKFMQRAAATAAANETQTPGSDDNSHIPKRQRLSTEPSSPGTPQAELDAIAAALKAEEKKRRDAVMRQAAEAGESEWVLDIPAANVSPTQPYAVAADSLDVEDDANVGGRRGFGGFKRKKALAYVPKSNDDDAESDEEDDDELMDPANPEQVAAHREKLKAKALAKLQRQRERERQNKTVNLKNLTSISGSGGGGSYRRESGGPSKKNKKKRKSS
ncbi:hypothetical protein N7481_008297 [Penicillium waksmanii]|uniref:uncharacterized protein n=1 Tax=Penicillium waksmanii TaxID=69791 RepID=UPI0025499D6F|nr:uncharacterized protein N7481_008297 [Penicillium waksmanii]KAJ5980999.1 hypothetical protein N7481_008297 [Penicillium waksmanii]